jgi:preprotein translocase subunit SecF
VIKEKVDSEEHNATFKAELTPDGKFPSGTARYVEEDGKHRVMTEDQIGLVSTPKAGRTVANIVLNLLHFAVWFLCLWLLLRFQWPHALGLALALWLTLTLTIVPMIL